MKKKKETYWIETNNTNWYLDDLIEQFSLSEDEVNTLKSEGVIVINREGYEEFEDGFEIVSDTYLKKKTYLDLWKKKNVKNNVYKNRDSEERVIVIDKAEILSSSDFYVIPGRPNIEVEIDNCLCYFKKDEKGYYYTDFNNNPNELMILFKSVIDTDGLHAMLVADFDKKFIFEK